MSERVISLRIGDVDLLPRRQDEDLTVKAIGIEQKPKFRTGMGDASAPWRQTLRHLDRRRPIG